MHARLANNRLLCVKKLTRLSKSVVTFLCRHSYIVQALPPHFDLIREWEQLISRKRCRIEQTPRTADIDHLSFGCDHFVFGKGTKSSNSRLHKVTNIDFENLRCDWKAVVVNWRGSLQAALLVDPWKVGELPENQTRGKSIQMFSPSLEFVLNHLQLVVI
jgi:hypothetical protein